ncbi:U-box domain-containing protein 33-like [Carica papaya]|uniref:U-box domain-containing protein 33-like n=1 Tax=Carica papaya TaxID=3649 RepID=UPI000B8C9E5E|nr:U-box domain-containing protein 33-like [Carica papaya]XP_021906292.1 U-box domain-containing protein 33-like [Carica papaya]XP_021906293.1 U-box domain-containing protein 33-like [Carica papaya]
MMDLKSNKAKYVLQNGPPSCQFWFICRGHLIHTWNENDIESNNQPISEDHHLHSSSTLEGGGDDHFYDQLEQAMEEAEKLKKEAFEESLRRIKSDRGLLEATRKARALEILYNEELRHRKEIEGVLARERENAEKMKQELDEERLIAIDQKLLMESQVASSDYMIKHLEDELASALELSQIFKKERDDFEEKSDNALKITEELLKKQAEDSSMDVHQFFHEFSVSEIQEATCNFDPSLKIGEGDYGSTYKGILRHTPVTVKILHTNSLQGPSEFQLEVDVLSKLRHPNLLTLIGVCPEIWALIYEYLPNGSLEDRLNCKGNSPPLSWQTRVCIATELCSVLIFLHSSNPPAISQGNLKPANILLDANYVSKLSHFSVCHIQQYHGNGTTSRSHRTEYLTDTIPYLDPQLFQGEELSPKSDVYSFGVILLQLLTRRNPLCIAQEVQERIGEENLDTLLDPLAGEWPLGHAKRLVDLALRCCEINRGSRPDLVSEVWRVLEPIRISCGFSSSSFVRPEEKRQTPSYFVCPILQEVMQDPHVTADGFTYEASALMEWFENGHDTSPMTNLRLIHRDLVPNRALRSAIQEWREQN